MLLSRHRLDAFYNFLPINKWPNQETKQYNKSISQSFGKFKAK